ncbi:MAG: cytochrome c biogenesis CcdA family protein [Pseudonocardia sp.]
MSGVPLAVAFGGGVVSFLSPCVFPLAPVYLSLVTGLDVAALTEGGRGRAARIAGRTAMFVAGFGAVFVALGLTATAFGQVLADHLPTLTRVAGLVVLAMALFLLGSLVLKAPWLYRELRFHPDLDRYGPYAAVVAGVAFGLGWTPCIGPVLTAVLAVAAIEEQVWRGGALLAVYALGLGLPFLVLGLAFGRLVGPTRWVRGHLRGIVAGAAVLMAGFGILLALHRLAWLTGQLQAALRTLGLDGLVTLG